MFIMSSDEVVIAEAIDIGKSVYAITPNGRIASGEVLEARVTYKKSGISCDYLVKYSNTGCSEYIDGSDVSVDYEKICSVYKAKCM